MPWLVVAALLAVAAALGWLAAFGFPRGWGDVLFFKQPAYMALHTGHFTLPTAIGYRPYVDVVYAAYPPLYTYASLAVFKLFGFGVHASLGFDVAVHLLLAGLLGWILWRKTGSQAAAALFILLSTGFLLPEGRPDELAALFALLAVMATVRRRYLLTALLLGLSLATQPTQAILGAMLCVSIDLAACGPGWRYLLRVAGIAAAAALICALVWLPAVAGHLPEAIAQFRAHSTDRWALGPIELLARERLWAGFWIFAVAFVAAGGLFLLRHPPAALRRGAGDATLLRGVLVSLPICIGFLLYLGSPLYGYRLLNFLYLAVALYLIRALAVSATRARTAAAAPRPPPSSCWAASSTTTWRASSWRR